MRLRIVLFTALGLAAGVVLPARANAQETASTLHPNSPRVTPWEAAIAYRGGFVESAGYGPFSTGDYFSQVTLAASRALVSRGRLALTVGAAWDHGGSGATARGAATSLTVHRLTAPITVRYRLTGWLDVFVRAAPGAAYEGARMDEPSAPATLTRSAWLPCGDATAGVAWAFADSRIAEHAFVWRVTAEGGYAWTGDMSLALVPDLPRSDPRLTGITDLGTLSLSGGFGRIGLAVGF